ncbi:MAG TPA: hypothetical protein VHU80_21915 [Polyangiaceae bacterium]|nr:hypothetical protein [Polyangiaceae bacterium]
MTFRRIAAATALSFSVATSFSGVSAAHPTSSVATSNRALVAHAPPRGTSLGSGTEEARYAAREAAAPQAKKYRGGDVIIISASVLVVILLVVLIIVLI